MATYVMEVFSYQDATSDKLWAVCVDGPRVISHWGKTGANRLQGGAPVKIDPGLSAQQMRDKLIKQKLVKGYRLVGKRTIEDGVIRSAANADTGNANQTANHLFPDAYTELTLREGWQGEVRRIAEKLNLVAIDEGAESLLVDVGQGDPVRLESGARSIVRVTKDNGPVGRLLILALGAHMKAAVFDRNGTERTAAAWLSEDQDGFRTESLTGDRVRELAEQAGLVMARLRFKTESNQVGLFV